MMTRWTWLAACAVLLLPLVSRAQTSTSRPYPQVVYKYEQIASPIPQKIYAAFINLNDPKVSVRVCRGGADPDGAGKWETTLMPPTKVADREGFDVVINGDFFSHLNGHDAEGSAALSEFHGGTPAMVSGPAVTDGDYWGHAEKKRPVFMINGQGRPVITELKDPPSSAREVVAGSDLLVAHSKSVAPPPSKSAFSKGPHPRTAVGLRDGGKTLVLVIIDGRKKGQAIGMSLADEAKVMLQFGCTDALNLDGGGSSVLAIRNPQTHQMEIKNHPSDGRERSVANVVGVSIAGTIPNRPAGPADQ